MRRLGMILAVTGLMVAMFVPVSNGRALSLALEVKQIWYVNKTPFILEGKAEPGSQVGIEGQNLFTYADDSGSLKIYLDVSEGGNFFQVVSQKGDQKTTKDIYVEKDSTPPVVTVLCNGLIFTDNKVKIEVSDAQNIDLICFTDPYCQILVDNEARNSTGNAIQLNIKLEKAPYKESHLISVSDKYGNTTNLDMTIINNHTKIVRICTGRQTMRIDDRIISIQNPIMKNCTYMLNLRTFCEIVEGSLSWDGSTKVMTIETDEIKLSCRAGSNLALLNGKSITFDGEPTYIEKASTFVPIKTFATFFGYSYDFDNLLSEIVLFKDIQP